MVRLLTQPTDQITDIHTSGLDRKYFPLAIDQSQRRGGSAAIHRVRHALLNNCY